MQTNPSPPSKRRAMCHDNMPDQLSPPPFLLPHQCPRPHAASTCRDVREDVRVSSHIPEPSNPMSLPRLCVRPLTQRKQILAWQGGSQACGRRDSSYAGFHFPCMPLLDSLLITCVLRPDGSLRTLAGFFYLSRCHPRCRSWRCFCRLLRMMLFRCFAKHRVLEEHCVPA